MKMIGASLAKRSAVELRHLRYFIAVAEELHFGRASARLGIVQPALTAQVKALEDLIGVPLLDRTKRRVDLTDAGREFLKDSYNAISQVDNAVIAAQELARGATGRLRIGYGANAAISGLIPNAITKFRRVWPNVVIDLSEMASRDVTESLLTGKIDVGYAAVAAAADLDLVNVHKVGRWPWVLAMSVDHQLTAKSSVRMVDIHDEKLAVYAEPGRSLDLSATVAPELFSDQVHRSDHIVNLITYVASGLAVAFVPSPVSEMRFPGVAFVALADPIADMEMHLMWPKAGNSPTSKNFISMITG
jgi:DNA-binding transcriptional LysR family regulator